MAAAGRPVPYGTLRVQATPSLVTPGGRTTVTATVSNNGVLDLDRVGFAVTSAGGWTVTATTPVTRSQVRSGQAVQASWQVAVPPDAHPGQAPVTVQAAYTAGDQRGVGYGSVSVLSAYATVADAFNNTGISDDTDAGAADLDGAGASYSAQALAGAGLGPGAVLTRDGLTFSWPDVPSGQPDNVIAAGQTILLSGAGSTLGFLGAAGTGAPAGSGTVSYTDGSTSPFDLALGGYLGPAAPGNEVAAVVPYVNEAESATAGSAGQAAYVFYAGVPITPAKTVQAVTLPGRDPASPGGLHIFAVAIGPQPAPGSPSAASD